MRKLGWIPDVPDKRDFRLNIAAPAAPLPPSFSRVPPFTFDQGQLGSCTANAVATVWEMTQLELAEHDMLSPSRLALYYNTRVDQGTARYDSGATIRGAIKAAATHGICKDASWPYVVAKFKVRPNAGARIEAANHRMGGTAYARVPQTAAGLKGSLFANNPIAFGFSVPESFMSDELARTGVMHMPAAGEAIVGGHAVTLIGWDDAKHAYLVQNSWGAGWGQQGRFWMPYDFVHDNDCCDDFWTIFKVVPL